MRASFAPALLASWFLMDACTAPTLTERAFDTGHLEGRRYVNGYFGLSMDMPEGWVLQDQAQTRELVDQGVERMAKDEAQERSYKKAAEVGTAYLVTLFRYEVGAPVPFNPSVIVVAENVAAMPGIKKGADYLFHTRKQLGSSALSSSFEGALPGRMVSGVGFDGMRMKIATATTEVSQDYYCTIKDGFALSIILSYTDSATADTLNTVVDGIQFTRPEKS